MTDIVERLRGVRCGPAANVAFRIDDLCVEAADEIERLRACLSIAADVTPAPVAFHWLGAEAEGVHDASGHAMVQHVRVERARRAFGDALSVRVNMSTRLGDVPVQALREAMAEALKTADRGPE